jgi:hypothetical protein
MIGFKCMNRGCGKHIPGNSGKNYFKYKDKTRMVKVHVCKECWEKARTLKCD